MSQGVLINPDTQFIREIMSSGGEDLKKCMQCGTCSVVCELAPHDSTFPRKQMFEAQWGLKEKLLGDPAIWLCHNCGDCTTYCPRNARPGDVFGALRQAAIRHFAWPRFAGRAVSRPGALLVLLIVPALLLWAVALPGFQPGEEAEFADLFPVPTLEILFFAAGGFVLIAFGVGLFRFGKALRVSGAGVITCAGLTAALVEILTHTRFSKCGRNQSRRWGHLLTLSGFLALAVMGTIVGIGSMAGIMSTPLPLTHPLKVFANAAAVVILAGTVLLLADRIKDPVKRAASTYFDWFFLLALTGVVLTGILSELLRLTQAVGVMYGVYAVHLLLVLLLFLYAPFSKFAHLVYRTAAMAVTRQQEVRARAEVTSHSAAEV